MALRATPCPTLSPSTWERPKFSLFVSVVPHDSDLPVVCAHILLHAQPSDPPTVSVVEWLSACPLVVVVLSKLLPPLAEVNATLWLHPLVSAVPCDWLSATPLLVPLVALSLDPVVPLYDSLTPLFQPAPTPSTLASAE